MRGEATEAEAETALQQRKRMRRAPSMANKGLNWRLPFLWVVGANAVRILVAVHAMPRTQKASTWKLAVRLSHDAAIAVGLLAADSGKAHDAFRTVTAAGVPHGSWVPGTPQFVPGRQWAFLGSRLGGYDTSNFAAVRPPAGSLIFKHTTCK